MIPYIDCVSFRFFMYDFLGNIFRSLSMVSV